MTGIWDKPVEVSSYKNVQIFGVRLFPTSLKVFFDMSLKSIKNTRVELESINCNNIFDIEFLNSAKCVNELIKYFNSVFESMLVNDDHIIINKLFRNIQLTKNIDEISVDIGVSRRHLTRLIKNNLGITTKSYLSIVRFIKAKELLLDGKSMNDIVFECGYYDQSHFAKDFKRYSGRNPSEYN